MFSTRTMGRDVATLRVLDWDGSSLMAGPLGGADPLGFAAGDANLYRYVGNDPTNATDPTGLCADDQIGNPLPKMNSTVTERRFTYTLSKTNNLTDAQLNYLKAMKAALIEAIIQAYADNNNLSKQDLSTLRQLAQYLNQLKIGLPVMVGDTPPAALNFQTKTVYISTTIIKTQLADLDKDGIRNESVCNTRGVAVVLIHESIHISGYIHKTSPDNLLTYIAVDVFEIIKDTPAWQEFLKSQEGNPFPF
jgi:hypothetical protein